MDTKPVRCLINSISRFIHLVSCQTLKLMPEQNDYENVIGSLKLLKQYLDEVADCKLPSDESLIKECEQLDVAVNEAREFVENWSPKMSKICTALRSDPLLTRIHNSSVKICHILCKLSHSSPSASRSSDVQSCMQELQCLKLEKVSDCIAESLKSRVVSSVYHEKITESLGITTSQDLLKERIAVEKERLKATTSKTEHELDKIKQVIDLISSINDYMGKLDRFSSINGVPIPLYFRCPLSLGLMSDPVIVASGQTYERVSIQRWLDNGLENCPQTHQMLSHKNLIPNFTVKALIENWCEENKIPHSGFSECTNAVSGHASPHDLIRIDSFGCSLPSSGCASRSSFEVGNGLEQKKVDILYGSSKEKFDRTSPEQLYNHIRSESASSVISSVESTSMNNHEKAKELSQEITPESSASVSKEHVLAEKQYYSSRTIAESTSNGKHNYPRTLSLPSPDSGTDNTTTVSQVEKLIEDLKNQSDEAKCTAAAAELRLLAKHNTENRDIVGRCGAIPPLVSLLSSEVKLTQEHSVTALLNLSINESNKAMIAEAGVIEPLIYVLKTGNPGAKENAAATIFSLSVLEEYKAKIGRSGAIKALVDLLGSGTLRGKKDAATALFNLSIFHENKVRIVKAGAVKYLVELMDPDTGMVDKAVALLANLSTIVEGRSAIVREGGIPLLVEVVEIGSLRGKENAASILLQLCIESTKFCTLVLQEGAVPPLVALSQSGTPRAKEKAQQLLSHFRSQREGPTKKGKS